MKDLTFEDRLFGGVRDEDLTAEQREEMKIYYAQIAIADRRIWESMLLGSWTFDAKYQREEIEKMLRRGEISEARAEELLREVKDAE